VFASHPLLVPLLAYYLAVFVFHQVLSDVAASRLVCFPAPHLPVHRARVHGVSNVHVVDARIVRHFTSQKEKNYQNLTAMSTRYLTARQAARLLQRVSCPDTLILDALVTKLEYVIRLAASKRNSHVMWRIPIFASIPAYNFKTMQSEVAVHLRKQGYYVKEFGDGITLWVSWRTAYLALTKKKDKKQQ
jgi:hypothetical protein